MSVMEDVRLKHSSTGEHDMFAHYVNKEEIINSQLTGEPVTALCGKKWLPVRNPEAYPVCPTCKEIIHTFKEN